jgi:hypothetical protein
MAKDASEYYDQQPTNRDRQSKGKGDRKGKGRKSKGGHKGGKEGKKGGKGRGKGRKEYSGCKLAGNPWQIFSGHEQATCNREGGDMEGYSLGECITEQRRLNDRH